MKKHTLYILLLSVMWTVAAQAGITNQHIYLKNGTVLDGYIQDQDGLGSYTICYYRATVRIPAAQHPQVTSRQAYPIAGLEKEWVEWAEANNAFNGTGDDRTLVLCNVSADSGWGATKVRVIEDGLNVKYIEMVPGGRTRDLKPGSLPNLRLISATGLPCQDSMSPTPCRVAARSRDSTPVPPTPPSACTPQRRAMSRPTCSPTW